MRRLNKFNIIIISFLLSLIIGFAQFAETAEHEHGRHRYRPEQFERDGRAEWQKVPQVIQAVGIREGQSVAAIGSGSGYFSRPFAKAVGPKGIVYCCDIATNLLEHLQLTALQQNLYNIVTVYAAMDRPMLPLKSVDVIFFCNTNHHLENRVDYYKGLLPILKNGGKLVVVDWKRKRQKTGPPPSHCVSRETVIQEMKNAGWEMVKEETFLPHQYFLIFKPVKEVN